MVNVSTLVQLFVFMQNYALHGNLHSEQTGYLLHWQIFLLRIRLLLLMHTQ